MTYTYPPNFDKNRAVELGILLDAAYSQLQQFNAGTTWTPPAGYTIVQEITAREPWKLGPFSLPHLLGAVRPVPFGFVATKDGIVYVIIRGTITPLEWMDDFSIQPEPFQPTAGSWGNTTKGFNSLHTQLMPQIAQALTTVQTGGGNLNSLFITGHSLGAALAHLATGAIFAQFQVSPTSYTFCGPRAGDPAFAAAFAAANLSIWRIFNTEDIVPTLPIAAIIITNPNMGMASTSPITHILPLLVKMFPTGMNHIGYPVSITFHKDTVADNHNLTNNYNSL